MEETQKIDLMEYDLFRKSIERGLKEGEEKGRKEGLKEGRKEGLKEGLIRGLELAIQARFGTRSRKLISKLRKTQDIQKLKQIANKFRKIRSIKEFEKILDGA